MKDAPSPNTADCNTIYRTLRQANQYPNMVCRLDLARQELKALPKELYNFVNLQELDIRYNSIPLEEIQVFQRQFPKCKVLYEPQTQDNENEQKGKEPEVRSNLGTLILSPNPDQKSIQLIDRVGKYLSGYSNSRVILEANYTSQRQQRDLQQKITSIKNLLYKAGANNQQVDENLINDTRQQNQQSNPINKSGAERTQIRLLGINFPANFSEPAKGY